MRKGVGMSIRVLLVDDEEELVSTLAERLSLRGIEADWVTTAEDALKQVETRAYDVAVLDVKIPKVSGLALKKMLEEKCPHLKSIFLTGHGSEDDFVKGTAESADRVLFEIGGGVFVHKKGELAENALAEKTAEIDKAGKDLQKEMEDVVGKMNSIALELQGKR
jgi:DNA-binding NtrC family response regulator